MQGYRIDGVFEMERWHADDKLQRRLIEIGEFVEHGRLQADAGHALTVEVNLVTRDPTDSFLQVHEADLSRRFRRPTVPVELQCECVLKFRLSGLRVGRVAEDEVSNALQRHDFDPFWGFEHDE